MGSTGVVYNICTTRRVAMAFIRKLKTKSGTYLAEVESVREGGKVRQRVIRYIGKDVNGSVVRKVATNQIGISEVRRHADVLAPIAHTIP